MFTKLVGVSQFYDQFRSVALSLVGMLSHPYMYEQNAIKLIGPNRQAVEVFSMVDILCRSDRCVVKIEGFEKYNANFFTTCNQVAAHMDHVGPVTCHLFKSPAGAVSFPLHTDPDHVVIVMLEGTKVFRNNEEEMMLSAGDFMLIPKNYPHEAINITDNTMLSIGLESFIVEKL